MLEHGFGRIDVFFLIAEKIVCCENLQFAKFQVEANKNVFKPLPKLFNEKKAKKHGQLAQASIIEKLDSDSNEIREKVQRGKSEPETV